MKMLPHSLRRIVNDLSCRLKKTVYLFQLNKFYQNRCVGTVYSPKILVAAGAGGIGNAVEATGLVQAIRLLWPTCRLTFVTPYAELFENWCVVDRVIADPDTIRGEVFDHTFLAYVYEQEHFWHERCALGQTHAPRVWKKKWYLKNEREYYVDMVRRCGYKGPCPAAYVTIKKPAMRPPDAARRVCIAACGSKDALWRHKRWPYYSDLVRRLCEQDSDVQICIVGTRDDELPVIQPASAAIIDLRGVYTLSETAWLMRHADLVIGNDSGPMHIADAVQAKGIVIFGPTCVIKNGPRNKIIPVSLSRKCSPCQYTEALETCENPECMQNLTADVIMERIGSIR